MGLKFLQDIVNLDNIQFVNGSGTNAGLINMDGNDLVLSNPLGDILLGDGSADVFIGDGVNNVDIRFEQSGSITPDNSNATLTIGGTGSLVIESPTITGTITLSGDTEHQILKSTSSSYGLGGAETTFVYGRNVMLSAYDDVVLRAGTSDEIRMFAGSDSAARMTIDQNGNVGIGTTSPNALLDVDNRIYLQNDGTVKWGASANAGHLTWDTNQAIVKGLSGQALLLGSNNTSARMTIDTSGNVGIGTTSPGKLLDVNGTFRASGEAFFLDQ